MIPILIGLFIGAGLAMVFLDWICKRRRCTYVKKENPLNDIEFLKHLNDIQVYGYFGLKPPKEK